MLNVILWAPLAAGVLILIAPRPAARLDRGSRS